MWHKTSIGLWNLNRKFSEYNFNSIVWRNDNWSDGIVGKLWVFSECVPTILPCMCILACICLNLYNVQRKQTLMGWETVKASERGGGGERGCRKELGCCECACILCVMRCAMLLSWCYTANRNFALLLFCIYAVVAKFLYLLCYHKLFNIRSSSFISAISFYFSHFMYTYQANAHTICIFLLCERECVCVASAALLTTRRSFPIPEYFVPKMLAQKLMFIGEVFSIECSNSEANNNGKAMNKANDIDTHTHRHSHTMK